MIIFENVKIKQTDEWCRSVELLFINKTKERTEKYDACIIIYYWNIAANACFRLKLWKQQAPQ